MLTVKPLLNTSRSEASTFNGASKPNTVAVCKIADAVLMLMPPSAATTG